MVHEGKLDIYGRCSGPILINHSRTYARPSDFRLHITNFCELYVFVDGDAQYMVEDQCHDLGPGDVILLQPNEVHKLLLRNESWYERFYILFPTDAFDYMNPEIPSPLGCFMDRDAGKRNKVSPPPEQRETWLALLREIDEIIGSGDGAGKILAYARVLQFLHSVNAGFLRQGIEQVNRPGPRRPRLLTDMLLYIGRNVSSIQGAGDVADHFYVSLPYASAFFKKHMNIHLSHYIQAKKISMAKGMLQSGQSVTEACFGSGFNDCSYFIKVFKRFVGTTPLKYMKTENAAGS